MIDRLRTLVEDAYAAAQESANPTVRPTSLRESGRVGTTSEQEAGRQRSFREESIETGTDLTAEERPRARRPQSRVTRSVRTVTSAERIRTSLRDPESFRAAILLREVLDAPVSKRGGRR